MVTARPAPPCCPFGRRGSRRVRCSRSAGRSRRRFPKLFGERLPPAARLLPSAAREAAGTAEPAAAAKPLLSTTDVAAPGARTAVVGSARGHRCPAKGSREPRAGRGWGRRAELSRAGGGCSGGREGEGGAAGQVRRSGWLRRGVGAGGAFSRCSARGVLRDGRCPAHAGGAFVRGWSSCCPLAAPELCVLRPRALSASVSIASCWEPSGEIGCCGEADLLRFLGSCPCRRGRSWP